MNAPAVISGVDLHHKNGFWRYGTRSVNGQSHVPLGTATGRHNWFREPRHAFVSPSDKKKARQDLTARLDGQVQLCLSQGQVRCRARKTSAVLQHRHNP